MDEAEIRAEIERRRKRAVNLRLRETVWNVYSSFFQLIGKDLKKEPDSILPEVKDSLRQSDGLSEFDFGGSHFSLKCVSRETEDEPKMDETETTEMTLSLSIDSKRVFEFEMRETMIWSGCEPSFYHLMGNVKAFIEGPWVDRVNELLHAMNAHRQEYWKKKNAPRKALQLKQDMENFGLE